MATPELRFADEDGNLYPDWETKKLGEVVTFPSERIEGSYISTEDMGYNIVKTSLNNRRGNRVIKEDIITSNIRPYLKKVWLSDGEYSCSSDIIILRCDKRLSPSFLYSIVSQDSFFAYQMKHSKGTKMPRGDKVALKKFTLSVPSLHEQQKIANLFSLIDEKIENLGEQVSNWKQYKQGLSQQLFSQQLRFVDEEGNSYPGWEEKKLGEVARIYQSETLAKGDLLSGNIPVYGANGIIGKTNKYNHTTSQVVVACRGICGVVNYTQSISWINGNAMVLNIDENQNIDKEYFYQALTNISFNRIISGSAQPQITRGPISKIKLNVPSLPEQQKIANLLSMADEKIQNLEGQENKWKLYKQALMQKMFV